MGTPSSSSVPSHKISSPIELIKSNTKGREDIIAGSIASAVARFLVAPFDVLKIRYQLDTGNGTNRRYGSLWSTTKTIYQREGLRSFWKGNLAATMMVVPYGAGTFFTQQKLKAAFLHDNRTPSPLFSIFSGSVAGAVGTLASYPLDLLRTRLASLDTSYSSSRTPSQSSHHSINSIPGIGKKMKITEALRLTLREHGIRGLYDGLSPALIGIVPYMGLQFGIYDLLKRLFAMTSFEGIRHRSSNSQIQNIYNSINSLAQSKAWESLAAGALAGAGSKFLTMPFDVLKKRYQVANFSTYGIIHGVDKLSKIKGVGLAQVTKQIFAQEGLRGFYKGTVPALIKAAPASGITFAVYEACTILLFDRMKTKTK